MNQHKHSHELPQSVVFYDHACSICRLEMLKLKKRDHLQRLLLVDISAASFDPEPWGLNLVDAMQQLHVLTASGVWLVGVPAVRHVYSEIGLGWLWWSTTLPGINYLSQRMYVWFARNRMAISRQLGLRASTGATCESGHCKITD